MNARPLRVLLLEDEPTDAQLIEDRLREGGLVFTLRVATTREAFEQALREFAPNAILADYKLPNYDGLSALRKARECVPDVPVIVVTGALGDETAVQLLREGAADYVLKDRPARLAAAVRGALDAAKERTQRRLDERQTRSLNQELEARVAERTALLRASIRDLENFSYSISHDLRAPLRAIDSFTGVLQEDYAARLDAEGRRLLQVIRTNTARMSRLIDDMLDYSRAVRRELALGDVDMAPMFQAVFDELRAVAGDRRIEFSVGQLPHAWADAVALHQIVSTLLSNAIKFTAGRDPARIEVFGEAKATETVYTVSDNGTGFDPQYTHKLFGLFQRLHGAEFEGAGIGLAIAKRLIDKHGGRIWAEGQPEQGATFHFALPRRPARLASGDTA